MKKHYRKILIGVVLVAVLVLAGVIYYQKSADANESFSLKMNEKSENISEQFKSNQATANTIMDRYYKYLQKTYGTLHDTSVYTVNGLRAESFPEYYAGAYINEDGKLIVQITNKYYSSKYKKSDWYQELTGIVESKDFYCNPVKYSYRELVNAISDITLGDLAKQIKELGASNYTAVMNDYKNCVSVCIVGQEAYDAVINKLSSDIYSVSVTEALIEEDATALREDIYGHYICEEPGFGGMFTVDIRKDGFSYHEGGSSSYFGGGSWSLSENRLTLKDRGYGEVWNIFFDVVDDCLIYDQEASHPFIYVDLPDGTKFVNKENVDEAWLANLKERILKSERERVENASKEREAWNKQRAEALSHVNKFPFQGSDFQGLVCFDASKNQTDSSMPILIWIEDASGNKLWESVMCRSEGEDNSYYLYENEDGINYIIEYNADTRYHFDMFSLDATGEKIDELRYDVPDNTDRAGFNTEVKKYLLPNSAKSIIDMWWN